MWLSNLVVQRQRDLCLPTGRFCFWNSVHDLGRGTEFQVKQLLQMSSVQIDIELENQDSLILAVSPSWVQMQVFEDWQLPMAQPVESLKANRRNDRFQNELCHFYLFWSDMRHTDTSGKARKSHIGIYWVYTSFIHDQHSELQRPRIFNICVKPKSNMENHGKCAGKESLGNLVAFCHGQPGQSIPLLFLPISTNASIEAIVSVPVSCKG